MATKIITKTGSGAPTTSDVDRGELAVDLTNKQLYTNDGSSIIKLGSGAGEGQWSLATNGDDIYYNDGNVGIGGVADTFGAGIATLQLNGTSTGSPTQAGALRFRSQNGTSSQCDIYSDNGYMSFYTGNSTTSTERMRIEANGNVGITSTDTVALTATGGVNGYVRVNAPTGQAAFSLGVGGTQKGVISYDNTDDMKITSDTTMRFVTNLTERMRIDADGRVGINGDPGTRTAADYIDQAKAKIKSWTAAIKTKLDEEPKANKKAVTLEVTDDAFEVIPTEDLVAEWMAGRAIGGGNAKLQVAGDVYASGTIYGKVNDVADHIKAITPTQIANWDSGTGGGGGGATTDGRISDTQIIHWDQAYGWGSHATAGYQPAGSYALVGASYTKSESDGKYELKGAGGLPAGDWACSGSITAVGNITAYSSSDERLKDDIEAMPVGLIDDIKPSTWNWKESGKASGGVVAQQLQSCGLGQWVNEAPNGELGVDYNALIGVLLAEVQSLKARVEELENDS